MAGVMCKINAGAVAGMRARLLLPDEAAGPPHPGLVRSALRFPHRLGLDYLIHTQTEKYMMSTGAYHIKLTLGEAE